MECAKESSIVTLNLLIFFSEHQRPMQPIIMARLTRFGANFANQISLPFLGTWTCTQVLLGGVTHQSVWEHAFDFEVQDPSKRFYKNEGKEVSDYFCYKLPVLACCDGQVVNMVDHLPDNLVGKLNSKRIGEISL